MRFPEMTNEVTYGIRNTLWRLVIGRRKHSIVACHFSELSNSFPMPSRTAKGTILGTSGSQNDRGERIGPLWVVWYGLKRAAGSGTGFLTSIGMVLLQMMAVFRAKHCYIVL
jgi:hypothetical protein